MMYILGEDKNAIIQITSALGESFYIKDATFTLTQDGVISLSGPCQIDRQRQLLYAQLAPAAPGRYQLEFTYLIGTETFKVRYEVIVRC
ncbi:hypothetical protein [Holdemania massiliensis]|uniref:hypothetical protein n=1 Tax=Holdemania massiliensis TaxID=1468449 RepID=UPI001F0575AB|nr:hypothetical protein [Holdemania massiliensis]MCH1940542.1 hypothetical protein [Holdemania massiliensis]